MALDVTVGLDPFTGVVRVNFDDAEAGTRTQADFDVEGAQRAAAAFLAGRTLEFTDTITGNRVLLQVAASPEVAAWLSAAASELRAHLAGEVDLRLGLGKVPKA